MAKPDPPADGFPPGRPRRWSGDRSGRSLVASGVLLAALVSCGPSAEKLEARRLVSLIDRMRSTPPERREPLIAAVEEEPVQGDAAKRARDRCGAAYRALHEGNQLESEVTRKLALPSPPPSAVADSSNAETKIRQATEAMPRCNEALAALRRASR